jgi:UDP-N-acetylmuramyl pentapeptide phosphotransferase/UDP-N-acetylglucosamine-1-phosphate transferase
VALLAVMGAIDDMRALPAAPRLALQCVAAGVLVAALPQEMQVLPYVPWWSERVCLFVGLVWFVNLVNFIDGIDWMTVAETVPVTGAIVLIGLWRRRNATHAGRGRTPWRDPRLCAYQHADRKTLSQRRRSVGSCCNSLVTATRQRR